MIGSSPNTPNQRDNCQQAVIGDCHLKALKSDFNEIKPIVMASNKPKELIRTVAHDLRNPLGGIAAIVNVLMEDGDLNTEQRDLLNLLKETAGYSLNLVNDLLEKGTEDTAVKEPIDICGVIKHCANLLHYKMAEKKQQLIVNLPENLEKLTLNRESIIRLLDNLLCNAIKFTHAGGIIRVSARQNNSELEIAVQDNGIGMSKKMQSRLFYGVPGRTGTAGEETFGLGLPICKQIVDEHGGRIWVKSKSGRGTTFHVAFPAEAQLTHMVA